MISTFLKVLFLLPAALIDLFFQLIGYVLVPVLAWLKNYEYRPSKKFKDRNVLSWPDWAFIFGNEEDGIDGLPLNPIDQTVQARQQKWKDDSAGWSVTKRVIKWAAFRNGVSNLRFSKWGVIVSPKKVRAHWDNPDKGFLVTQGFRASLRLYWTVRGKRFRTWIGWGLYPYDKGDAERLAPDDGRYPGTGFRFQPFKSDAL